MKFEPRLIVAAAMLACACTAQAAVTAEEARQLGTTLTVVGAEKAGNKEGTIPEYTGGLTTAPAGFDKAKGIRPDPFAAEKPLYSIDAKNMDKYADKLTEGTKALMKAYPSYRVDVYATHRTVAYPKFVLDQTLKNATQAKTVGDGVGLQGARAGVPFPIPKSGIEAMWNFQTRYVGQMFEAPKAQFFNVDSAGRATLSSQAKLQQDYPYYDLSRPDNDLMMRLLSLYTAPARRAGEALMGMDPIDPSANSRRAWQYLPGQRRVRLAPDIDYDTPNASTGGGSTYDDASLFNGKMDRYDFKLVGKKEVYVPYNAYRFVYNDKPEETLGPKHIDPASVRWELHRVWVVEAKLKEGKRHIYHRRTFYLDEDSWVALTSEQYDARGQLWRVGMAYVSPAYDAPAVASITYGHYDLIAGSYYVAQLPGPGGLIVRDKLMPDSRFSPDMLAGQGVR